MRVATELALENSCICESGYIRHSIDRRSRQLYKHVLVILEQVHHIVVVFIDSQLKRSL